MCQQQCGLPQAVRRVMQRTVGRRLQTLTDPGARAAGALAPGTAPAMADELAGYTSCRDLSPGLMQMHWKARLPGSSVLQGIFPAAASPQNPRRFLLAVSQGAACPPVPQP